jgi:HD-GYP domain-containing protein (c-di-GMP phosphodiesterase class II)/ABC-type amino acid transport substrate-binding protein
MSTGSAQENQIARAPGGWRTTIRLTVVAVFLLATFFTAAIAIGLQYYFGQVMARDTATRLYAAASSGIAAELANVDNLNSNIMTLLADNPVMAQVDQQQAQLAIFAAILEKNPLYYGIYLGRADGSFVELINLDNSDYARRALRALPTDRWVTITVAGTQDGALRTFEYLDEGLNPRVSRSEATGFDVTSRPWYAGAIATNELVTTDPYLFAQLGVPGRTLSKRVSGTDTVVAIDMTLAAISGFLRDNAIADQSEIYLYDTQGQLIASSVDDALNRPQLPVPEFQLTANEKAFVDALPELRVSNELDWPPFDFALAGQPSGYSIDIMRMLAAMTGIRMTFVNGYSWPELLQQFERGDIDILHSTVPSEDHRKRGLLGDAYAQLPYALASLKEPASLTALNARGDASLAIPAGWAIIPMVRASFPNIRIEETGSTLGALESVATGQVDAALDNEVILRYISRHYFLPEMHYTPAPVIGELDAPDTLHILVQRDAESLRALLDRAIEALGEPQYEYLASTWLDFDTTAAESKSSTVPSEEMLLAATQHEMHGQLLESSHNGKEWLMYIAPAGDVETNPLYVGIRAPESDVVAPYLEEVRFSIAVTAGLLVLVLPLSWLFATPVVRPIRQLAAENDKVRRREYDLVERVPSKIQELDELSESMVSMVESIRAYELAQRKLMDSIIQLIAQAIDDKSAYTGGHCERVPELALMLAESASSSSLPAFRNFSLSNDDEWREYRIAAWLHDCGKITTPEHIVDKGSKLETIYNRIHEVRMRFEVLWRDAEIDYLHALARPDADQPALAHALEKKQESLRDDFEFIAACNVGGEYLDESAQQRLNQIAETTWQRHFDDCVGLSPMEELRAIGLRQPLPASERLLSDKPSHLFSRTASVDYPEKFGINMDIPEHLANLGEIYNLSISRGTLTAEDRFRINEHMISTIKMLESLPFPEELKNVPRYASTHHETMKGTGYPRRLQGDQLSIPERILAVADVFEALTASDRPYKKAKTISEALDILAKMVDDNHIDRDCFELFVREKVFVRYAEAFLGAEQIDEVEVGRYLGAG